MKNFYFDFFLLFSLTILLPVPFSGLAQVFEKIGNMRVRGNIAEIDSQNNLLNIRGSVSILFPEDKNNTKMYTENLRILGQEDDDTFILGEPKNQFCGNNFRVQTDLMTYFVEREILIFKGNVNVEYKLITMKSEEFTVNRKTFEFRAISRTKDKPVEAFYVEALDQFSKVKQYFDSDCKLLFNKKSEYQSGFLVAAQEISWKPDTQSLSLQGEPKISEKQAEIELSADRFKIFFDKKFKPNIIQANGNFKIIRQGQTATSQEAIIDLKKKVVTLKGNVKLSAGNKFRLNTDVMKIPLKQNERALRSPNRKINIKINP